MRAELLDLFTHFEEDYRKKFPLFWLVTLLGPVVLTIAILVVIALVGGWEEAYNVVVHAFLTFFVFGRFIILLGMPDAVQQAYEVSMSAGALFALVTYMDVMVALFVTFHMGFLFRTHRGPKNRRASMGRQVHHGIATMDPPHSFFGARPVCHFSDLHDRQYRRFDFWTTAGAEPLFDCHRRAAGKCHR